MGKWMIHKSAENWMNIPSSYLKSDGGPFIFDCYYDFDLLNLKGLLQFYIDILKMWSEIKDESTPKDCLQIQD